MLNSLVDYSSKAKLSYTRRQDSGRKISCAGVAKMSKDWKKKTKSWEMSQLAQIGGAYLLGGGVIFFMFRNDANRKGEAVLFSGGGIGLGGSIGGVSLDEVTREIRKKHDTSLSWSHLECKRPFSWEDLHNSAGTVTQIGASFMVGISLVSITAGNTGGPLFDSASLGGTAGVSLIAGSFAGVWSVLSKAHSSRDSTAQVVGRTIQNNAAARPGAR